MSFDRKLKNNWLNDRIRMKHLFNKCIRWQTRLHVEQIEKSSLSPLNAPCGYTFQVFYRELCSQNSHKWIGSFEHKNFLIISATLCSLSINKCIISTAVYWGRTITKIYDENNPISDNCIVLGAKICNADIVSRKHVNKCCVVFSASFFSPQLFHFQT